MEPNNAQALSNKVAALNNIGILLSESEDYLQAIEYHDMALAIEPYYIDALNNKGSALSNLGNYQEAIVYYDRALAIEPSLASTHNYKIVLINSVPNTYPNHLQIQ